MPQDSVHKVIKALSSRVRREILWRVWDRERAVAEIADGLGVTGPTLSGHLAVLRDAGLIGMRRDGTTRWYLAQRDAVSGFRGLLDDSFKWSSARAHPEQRHASSGIQSVVVVSADAPCVPADAFRGFTDPRVYGDCIGGEVTLENGRFSANLPFGQKVRGAYLHTCAPALIVMEWDFHFEDVPVPGDMRRAHLLITPAGATSCRMEVTQFISSPDQETYMTAAWRYVLGSFSERLTSVLADAHS